jgi:hypothetical protein
MALQRPAAHRTVLVVDVEGFGDQRRTNSHRVAVRDGLYRALKESCADAAIPWNECHHEDCGDGVLVLVPAEVPKGSFVESLPHALIKTLREHNRTHYTEERIRLRMALHAGEVNYDDHGVTAASINLAFRLLDAPALKAALAESSGVLAIIVSSWFFDEVVRHSATARSGSYRQFSVAVKETITEGWICLPDHLHMPDAATGGRILPSGISAYVPEASMRGQRDRDHGRWPTGAAGISVAVPTGQLPAEIRGRDQLLAELRKRLRKPPGDAVILAGLGGVGKSTVAAAFSQCIKQDRRGRWHPYVWWVSAVDRASLTGALVTVARQLGAAQADVEAIGADAADAPDRLWALLQRARRRWLIVFDNADDPSVLARSLWAGASAGSDAASAGDGTGWMRPTRRGLVLVTSRNGSPAVWGRHARVIAISPLAEGDAARVLLDHAPGAGDEAEARTLARRLGGLPLALRLAGSYLGSAVALRASFVDYRRGLDDSSGVSRLLTSNLEMGAVAGARKVVMHTWEMSLDALAESGTPQARPLLRLLSCYAGASPIPLWLLAGARLGRLLAHGDAVSSVSAGADAEHRLEDALHQLRALDLIDVRSLGEAGTREHAVVVHPVIADTNRAHLLDDRDETVDAALVRRTAVGLVVAALGCLDYEQPADCPRFLLLAPHLHALLQTVARHIDHEQLRDLVITASHAAGARNRCGSVAAGEALSLATLDVLPLLGDDDPASLLARHM